MVDFLSDIYADEYMFMNNFFYNEKILNEKMTDFKYDKEYEK